MLKLESISTLDHIWKNGEFQSGTRKIIIFLTDQSSHYALDGLLGGIVTPAGKMVVVSQIVLRASYFSSTLEIRNFNGCMRGINSIKASNLHQNLMK